MDYENIQRLIDEIFDNATQVHEGVVENEFEGESYILKPGRDLTCLPDRFREVLDDEDVRVYNEKDSYFADLAKKCRLNAMQDWLQAISDTEDWYMEVARCDEHEIFDVIFWFRLPADNCVSVTVAKEPREEEEPSEDDEPPEGEVPALIRHVGELIGGTTMGFGVAGGISTHHWSLEDEGYPPDDANMDLSKLSVFWRSCSGERIAADETTAYWCDHSGQVIRIGDLAEVLNAYFRCELEGGDFDSWASR
jgi:hypothetical protein